MKILSAHWKDSGALEKSLGCSAGPCYIDSR